jgi:tetratricopeptide (TPR) repeat protein
MKNYFFSLAKSRIRLLFLIIILSSQSLSVSGQTPSEEFFRGLDLLNTDQNRAKQEFLIALDLDTLFHGTYHFLGVIYLNENNFDSAIYCFNKSIQLNKENIRHTKEMTYVRLIDTYLYQHDFNNSFSVACEAFKKYPENNAIAQGLKDVCLWSFYTKFNNLDVSYLSKLIRDDYVVNSIPEEYLIIRRIRIDNQYLQVVSQSLITKKKTNYDVLKCSLSESNKTYNVKFKLNWDLNKDFGGKVANTDIVYSNANNPVYERIGAKIVSDPKIDLKKEIDLLADK